MRVIAYEQGGNGIARNYTDILVYQEGINVFAIITKPIFGEEIPSDQDVMFNASDSFVAKCLTSSSDCSLNSDGMPCYLVNSSVDNLYCYNFNKTNIGKTYDLMFDWIFDAGQGPDKERSISGTWFLNYSNAVAFDRGFYFRGKHTADLKVTYGFCTGESCY